MALNKQLYKTPEEKMRAFHVYRQQNCNACKGCHPCGGSGTAFAVQMCFTAWLESEADASFADGYYKLKAKQDRESAIFEAQQEAAEKWLTKYPTLNSILNPALKKPPLAKEYGKHAKPFSLDLPVFYRVKGSNSCRSDLAEFSFGKREVRFATALGAKTVKTLLAKTDKDLEKAASKSGLGKAMIAKFSNLIADTRKLATDLGIIK